MFYFVKRTSILSFATLVGSLFLFSSGLLVPANAADGPPTAGAPGSKANPVVGGSPTLPPPSPEQLNVARMLSRTFTQVANQVGPSVVSIKVEGRQKVQGRLPFFFRNFPFGDEEEGNPFDGQGPAFQGAGSGFVVDEKGFIATNRHVVQNADKIVVVFADGKEFKAKLAGADPRLDIAIIKIVDLNGYKLRAAKLADSNKIQVAEWVMAIGNPFGLDHTVTVGVISATGRKISDMPNYQDLIQTDASINRGNSGGPLINLDGEVVGINTMIVGPNGGNVGIGFAIPINAAKNSIQELIATGKVSHAYIGIGVREPSDEQREMLENALGIQNQGVVIGKVAPNSPAEKAGLQAGDILLKIDGRSVTDYAEVSKFIGEHKIGDTVSLEILRKWKRPPLMVKVKTEEFPQEDQGEDMKPGKRR